VPLSMKMPRSMAKPECSLTGQSTNKVNALFFAAANAFMAPEVSSVVPLHDTHALMDLLFFGIAGVALDPVVVDAVDVAGVPAAVVAGLPVVLVDAAVDVADVPVDAVVDAVVDAAVELVVEVLAVTVVPTVLFAGAALVMVPLTLFPALVVVVTVAAVEEVEAVPEPPSLEPPPQPARVMAMDNTLGKNIRLAKRVAAAPCRELSVCDDMPDADTSAPVEGRCSIADETLRTILLNLPDISRAEGRLRQ
jgi:hypothetical protein